MLFFTFFFLEFFLLFFLSKLLTKSLSKIFLGITKSQTVTIHLLSFLFLPGVIVHELSHLLVAGVLFVRTGEIEFVPKITKNGVKLGSVEIATTDPIRRAIIGFAPVFVGLSIILGLVYFALDSSSIVQTIEPSTMLGISIRALIFYLLFVVSNTMFSSSRDLEGTIEILITLLIIFIASYIIGFRPPLSFIEKIFTEEVVGVVQQSSMFLLVPIFIDLIILGTIRLIYRR